MAASLLAIGAIPLPDHVELPARVVASDRVEVTAPMTSSLEALLVEPGDVVVAGAPVARFDTGEIELELAQRRAALTAALSRYQTARRARDAAAQTDLDLEVAQIETAMRLLELRLATARVKSPLSGRITATPSEDRIGATLPAGEIVVLIEAEDSVHIEATATERDVTRIGRDRAAEFRPDAAPESRVAQDVRWISPAASRAGGVNVHELRTERINGADALSPGMEGVLAITKPARPGRRHHLAILARLGCENLLAVSVCSSYARPQLEGFVSLASMPGRACSHARERNVVRIGWHKPEFLAVFYDRAICASCVVAEAVILPRAAPIDLLVIGTPALNFEQLVVHWLLKPMAQPERPW